jgi:threonine/homoserine/homoserine lactone efflux protein
VLSDTIGELLPLALAVALSPPPVIAVVVILGTSRARRTGPAFALGWVAGLVVVSLLVVTVLDTTADADDDDPGLGWLKVAIAILFLVLARKQWKKRPEAGEPVEMPKWMQTISAATPLRATLYGAALSGANPKNLALTLAAAASIAEAGLDPADQVIAVTVFIAIGSAAVGGPVLLHVVHAERAAHPLAAVKQFMTDNNAVIMMVILLLLGANLLGEGVAILQR